jgi:hypothetical protein
MVDPIIKIKRSSVEGKIPTPDQLPIGEIALNTYDGKLYASKNVGIGTTVFVVNPWSVGTGTNTYNSYFTNGNVGIGTTNPPDKLTVSGKIQIQQDSGSNNRLVFRGQPGSSYRWNVDNYSSSNEFRIYREDDLTSANGSVAVSISTTGTVTATKFSGDGSLLTNLPTGGGGGSSSQWVTTSAGIHTLSNVGIGTTNPTQKLEVVGGEIKAGRIDSSSEGGQLSFGRSTDNANAWYIDVYGNTSTPDLRFVDVSNAAIRAVIDGSGNFGLNTALPTSRLDVVGDAKVSGVVTATTFIGNLTGTATTATNLANAANITTGTINSARLSGTYNISISGNAASATYATSAGIATYATSAGISTYATSAGIATEATRLQTARTFEITGDVVSSAISFDGSGNVSLAATIQPNSVALGSDTTGDYVSNITGTSNQITVTSGTGEGSTPTLSIPNQFTVPQDITVTRDLQVNRNLNVTGNVTIGGTAAFIDATELRVSDPDIVLGFRTDSNGNDNTTDNTANHGGIAVASTEGTPLVNLFIAGIETNPSTYKKIMWFKAGTFAGLGTDAWLSNYAVGIGSTQFPTGTRLAAGSVQFTENDLAVVRNINASGIITATGGFNLGISSAGTSITSGPVTRLNFIGAGNTFAVNGTTVDISIAGGGGGSSVSISTVAPSSPTAGDLWYNSNLGRTFIYYNDGSSSQWVDAAPFNPVEPPSTPGKTSSSFTATEGQTSFSVSYTVGYIDVFLNGVRLNTSEFTASNGSSIVLLEGATAGDVLDVVEYRMGIGDTGATGSGGPLSNITQTTSSSIFYPVIAIGTGSTLPYITTTSNYFEFTPSSGTLEVNQLVVAGVTTATDFNSTSDRNLKENINIIEDPLEKLVGISGVTFNWKESKESSAGVIAQDVEKVLPEIVKSNDDMKTVNYNGLIGLLVEAVKNQQDQINSLTERIKSLEGN